jgi:hypothetical protein
MKRIISISAALIMTLGVFAQSPENLSYQSLVRDAENALLRSQVVGMQISILQGSVSGASVYVETQTPNTNLNGMVSIEIGEGTIVSGAFNLIDWSTGPYFIKTETDPAGGTSYSMSGTSQLMSVPYALKVKETANGAEENGSYGTGSVSIAQTLIISEDTLFISSGNYIVLPSSTPDLQIGDFHQGGIVFSLDGNGGGLIAATFDQSTLAEWGCFGKGISAADGVAIGTGAQNTIDIELGCTQSGTAADICANLTLGGYSDWFLPSKDELNEMHQNIGQRNALGLGNVGGFANNYYWSSTENDTNIAWLKYFGNGIQFGTNKSNTYYVRAVRAF